MDIALYILGTLSLILIGGKVKLSFQFKKEVQELFAQSKSISNKIFYFKQLDSLPEPVQRYLKHVLKDGQPYISYARITHDGQFKTGQGKNWMDIKGEQYFTTEKPGFIWKGATTLFTARDMYVSDKGRLVVSLLSLINIVDGEGEKFNEGELQRWLGESVWFPTNFLPSERLQWSPIDQNTAKVTFNYHKVSFFYVIRFNAIGEIVEMETQRYMDASTRKTWISKLSNYKELNGIIVPTSAEAIYRLEKGDYSYAKFNLKRIHYNESKIF